MTASDTQQALLKRLFSAIDARDTETFAGVLAEDAVFRFGSGPQVEGRDAIAAAVEGFFASIAALSHVLDKTLASGDTLVCEGEVTYTRHDGSDISLPFANVFELDGPLISHYKIYIDIAPLFAK